MEYLSVVQICPDLYKDVANAIADAAGLGDSNLSVKLVDTEGGIWWGCHAVWRKELYYSNMSLPPEAPQEFHEALSNVISSAQERDDFYQHWVEVLEANGFIVYATE